MHTALRSTVYRQLTRQQCCASDSAMRVHERSMSRQLYTHQPSVSPVELFSIAPSQILRRKPLQHFKACFHHVFFQWLLCCYTLFANCIWSAPNPIWPHQHLQPTLRLQTALLLSLFSGTSPIRTPSLSLYSSCLTKTWSEHRGHPYQQTKQPLCRSTVGTEMAPPHQYVCQNTSGSQHRCWPEV